MSNHLDKIHLPEVVDHFVFTLFLFTRTYVHADAD
jgi:hypothetical protein